MREEIICRICFNLINDIDYHLKEAQEKTDEITAKFLDKEKDPLSYKPQPIVTPSVEENAETEMTMGHRHHHHHREHHHHYSRTTDDDDDEFSFKSSHQKSRKRRMPSSKPTIDDDTDLQLTEDEMSVNSINRNKAKLLSHVLNPNKKSKQQLQSKPDTSTAEPVKQQQQQQQHKLNKFAVKIEKEDGHEEEDDEDDDEEEDEEEEEEVTIKASRRLKSRGSLSQRSPKKRGGRRPPVSKKYVVSSATSEEDETDEEGEVGATKRSSRSQAALADDYRKSGGRGEEDSEELVTVNMDDLGDLLSKPKVYYARKSEPHRAMKASMCSQPVSSTDEGPVDCDMCHKSFKRRTNLQLHMEKVHQMTEQLTTFAEDLPETHKCSQCPREFTNEKSLYSHIEDHQIERERMEKERNLFNNKVPNSVNDKPPDNSEVKATCPQCNKTFRRLFNMRTHVNRVHNKVKPFTCNTCDKAFATNSDLKQHMVVHGQGKMFSCEICNRQFSNRDSIILHRKQHSQQRTHFCSVCNKGFYKASCLNRHLRTHTGERPYECTFCLKCFSQSTTLKAHRNKCLKNPDAFPHDPLA